MRLSCMGDQIVDTALVSCQSPIGKTVCSLLTFWVYVEHDGVECGLAMLRAVWQAGV
jgi:hypothetical protein